MSVVTVTLNPCIDKTFAVDRMIADRKLTATDIHEHPGGGGINVARVVTRLGGDVVGLWSRGGHRGTRLGRLLDEEAVAHHAVDVEQEIRENLSVHDDSTDEQFRFGMPGPVLSAGDRERWLSAVRGIPASATHVVVSGSLPQGAPLDWFDELLGAVPAGARLIVDTKREALHRALERGVYLIKPNMSELAEFAGRELVDDADIEHAAQGIIERGGAEVVVASLGRGGALLVTGERAERFTAPAVRFRSKIGAGDSMVGGMATALSQQQPLREAVWLGVVAGAAAVMTPGTDLCRPEDVERLLAEARRSGIAPIPAG